MTAGRSPRTPAQARRPVVLWDGRIDLFGTWVAGIRTWPWKWAPSGLASKRQLAADDLRPGGQEPYGRIVCRRGRRWAWLYRIDLAKPKRQMTPGVQAALAKAMQARRRCPECGRDAGYCIPRVSLGSCVDCWLAAQPDITTTPVDAAVLIPAPREPSTTAFIPGPRVGAPAGEQVTR